MSDRLALLERAQQGDDRAEAQLLTENAGLIWSIVRRYNGCGVETDDLYQLGCIGFVKAVKGFDLTYGTQFSTYAVPKIAGEIRRFLRDDGPVKVGRTMREKGQTLWAARERLQGRLGCEPKLSQLAAETGMTPEEIAAVKAACNGKLLKVIIETCLLTDEEKIALCRCVSDSGADYIKTSTGFSKAGATFHDVELFAAHVAPHVKIKAAGGISSLADAEKFIMLGASRLGTSRIVKIAKGLEGSGY